MFQGFGHRFLVKSWLWSAQEQYSACALRLWLVSTHYRSPVNYTQRALEEASERAYYIYQAVRSARGAFFMPRRLSVALKDVQFVNSG